MELDVDNAFCSQVIRILVGPNFEYIVTHDRIGVYTSPKASQLSLTQDEEDEDEEEEGGLSKSGKELKKLLGRSNGLNESEAEDDDDEDDDDDVSFCDTCLSRFIEHIRAAVMGALFIFLRALMLYIY